MRILGGLYRVHSGSADQSLQPARDGKIEQEMKFEGMLSFQPNSVARVVRTNQENRCVQARPGERPI